MRSTCVTLVLVTSAWLALPLAQAPERDFAAWSAQVAAHRPGERDGAVRALETWTKTDVERLVSDVGRLARPERATLVSQALVLHADVAVFNRTLTGYSLPPGDTNIMLSEDGQRAGQMQGTFHWAFCRELIDRLPRGDERTRIARAFYRATGAVLQLWGEHVELEPHLREGLRIIGDDAVLRLYEGTMHQVFASPRLQRVFEAQLEEISKQPMYRPRRVFGVPDMPPTANEARTAAERAFRRALSEDPSLVEARVRLSHVLFDRGRIQDAAEAMGSLPAITDLPPFVRYYAAVLAGSIARASGRADDAEHAFSLALAVEPRAQVPRVALSELALASGQRDVALTVLLPLAVPTGDAGISDPWWVIGRSHGASARQLIDTMARALQ